MKDITPNTIIHAFFEEMCRLLKEKDDIPNKAIAIDMGIDFSIFSKLLSGKKEISELYRQKIYQFFQNPSFDKYAEHLKTYFRNYLNLSEQSHVFRKIIDMSYSRLVSYLLFEITFEDLHFEEQITRQLIFYIRRYFSRLLLDSPSPNLGYEITENSGQNQWLESRLELPSDHIIELSRHVQGQAEKSIYIILCPKAWKNSSILISDSRFIENADRYFLVRFEHSFPDSLHNIDNCCSLDGCSVSIETFNVSLLCREARHIADMLFRKICQEE